MNARQAIPLCKAVDRMVRLMRDPLTADVCSVDEAREIVWILVELAYVTGARDNTAEVLLQEEGSRPNEIHIAHQR